MQQKLLLLALISMTWAQPVAEMCDYIKDGLGAAACESVVETDAKGFRLTGTMANPLRYDGLGFDDNIAGGATPGALNVCMLAAFGNGGVVLEGCVPTWRTAAEEWNGRPELHYFGMLGFGCGFNDRNFAAGETIVWDFPTGNTCVGDFDLDVGLTSITCMFEMSCELGTTTTTTGSLPDPTSTTTTTYSMPATNRTSSTTSATITKQTTYTRPSATTYTTTSSLLAFTDPPTTSTLFARSTTAYTASVSTTVTAMWPSITSTVAATATAAATLTTTTTPTATIVATTAFTTTIATITAVTTTTTTWTFTATSAATTSTSTSSSTSTSPLQTRSTMNSSNADATTSLPSESWTTTGTTSEINMTGLPCREVPVVVNAADLSDCAGAPHGAPCDVQCADGFGSQDASSLAVCQDGSWLVRGECLREGAEVVQKAAAQAWVELSLDLPEAGNHSSADSWAEAHETALYVAFAAALQVHPSDLRLEFHKKAGERRLQSSPVAFAVRVTVFVEPGDPSALQTAAEELESISADAQMQTFGSALMEELYSETEMPRNISVSASVSSVATVDRYVLPEAYWWIDWDSSACAACNGAQEVGQLFCSRGPWLACSGPESGAGPMPPTYRSCPPCQEALSRDVPRDTVQLPVWFAVLLSAFAILGCCSALLLGICVSYRCMHWMPRVAPEQLAEEGISKQRSERPRSRLRFLRLPVRTCWSELTEGSSKHRRFTGDFCDLEPGVMHVSTLHAESLSTSKPETPHMARVKTTQSTEDADVMKLSTMCSADGGDFRQCTTKTATASTSPAPPDTTPTIPSLAAGKCESPQRAAARPRSHTLLDRVDLQ